ALRRAPLSLLAALPICAAALGGGSRVSAVRAGGAARAVRSGLSCPAGILSVGAGVLTFLGNVDLLTVGEHPGQIHRIRGGVALQPACGLDGVLDPRTGGE